MQKKLKSIANAMELCLFWLQAVGMMYAGVDSGTDEFSFIWGDEHCEIVYDAGLVLLFTKFHNYLNSDKTMNKQDSYQLTIACWGLVSLIIIIIDSGNSSLPDGTKSLSKKTVLIYS